MAVQDFRFGIAHYKSVNYTHTHTHTHTHMHKSQQIESTQTRSRCCVELRGELLFGYCVCSDQDMLWTKERETQKQQVKRATSFLYDLWTFAPEKVRSWEGCNSVGLQGFQQASSLEPYFEVPMSSAVRSDMSSF